MTRSNVRRTPRAKGAGARRRALLAALFCVFALVPWVPQVRAADEVAEPAVTSAEAPVDFRGKVTLGYGVVVGALVLYVLVSARRNARLTEEIAFLEQRLSELEKK